MLISASGAQAAAVSSQVKHRLWGSSPRDIKADKSPGTVPVPGLGTYLEPRYSKWQPACSLLFCHSPGLREVGIFSIFNYNSYPSTPPQAKKKKVPQNTLYYLTLTVANMFFHLEGNLKVQGNGPATWFLSVWHPNMWFSWPFQIYPLVITAQHHHLKISGLSTLFSSQSICSSHPNSFTLLPLYARALSSTIWGNVLWAKPPTSWGCQLFLLARSFQLVLLAVYTIMWGRGNSH